LKGARFVASAEVEEGRRLAEATVKALVSGDKVSARFLHKEFFEFSPICKLWLVANDKPRIRDDDDAIWRRILQIPFDEVIPEAERDPTVKDILTDLSQSGSAILNWLLEGVQEWRESGLGIPPAVREATAEFRRDMDPLVEWMQECVEIDPSGNATETNSDAWQSYQKWCDDNGIRHSIGRRTFSTRLRQRFEQGRDGRTRFWIGFALVSESQEGTRYEWGPSRDDEYE
jgi:putative DNA primase/helicase